MASIDGLSSGLDTTTIISQLMGIEKAPQQRLTTRRLAVLAQGTAWGQIESALTALKTTAGKIANSGMGATKASSSQPAVATLTSSATALPGSHTLEVRRLARSHQVQSTTFAGPTTTVGAGSLVVASGLGAIGATAVTAVGPTSVATGRYVVDVRTDGTVLVNGTAATVTDDGKGTVDVAGLRFTTAGLTAGTTTISVATSTSASTSFGELAEMLSGVRGDVSAVAVDDGSGSATSTRLVLSATQTGAASALSVSATGFPKLKSGDFTSTVPDLGQLDAELVFDGVTVRRGSNTVPDLVSGATLALVKAEPGTSVTLAVTEDTPAVVASVKELVDALNATLRSVGTATKYDVASSKGGALVGDSGARSLTNQMLQAVSEAGAATSTATLGGVGITLQRDGTYALDEAALTRAMAEAPSAVSDLVTAVSTRLTGVVDAARGAGGVVTSGKDGADRLAATLQLQVDAWDVKLALVETRLRRQFTGLESALNGLKNQGSWLAGQLASLPSSGS